MSTSNSLLEVLFLTKNLGPQDFFNIFSLINKGYVLYNLSIFIIKMKKCSHCKNNKELLEFSKSKSTKDGLQYKCKLCEKESNKKARQKNPNSKYYNQNKEYYKEYYDNWINNNREKWNKYINNYRKENLEKIREYQNIWVKNKYNTDINYRLKTNIRSKITDILNMQNILKKERTIKYLGCSIKEFKIYLENKFQEGMSWDNYGKYGWHVDHIIPCSSFDLTDIEQQKICFHYTNLQPLWAKDNLQKSNKIL